MMNKIKKAMSKKYFIFFTIIFFFLLGIVSCRSSHFFGPVAEKIIIITLDTTRADRLGCYGNENIETPHLDRMASEGILFEDAVCQAPMTLPSHATIMTGLYPPNHGVRNNTGYVLRDEMTTLVEILKERGYKTGAAISAFVIASQFGLAQGFDSYNEEFRETDTNIKWVQREAEGTINAAIEWLEENRRENKIFFWLHLYDPHADYLPPEPFRSRYRNHLYDGEIAYMDKELGRFFEYLKSINIFDEALFVIVGDHGEALGEHKERTHELLIYEATMKVPFIIKWENFKGGLRVSSTVSTTDIFPTLMQVCRIKDYKDVDGESLVPLLTSSPSHWDKEYYMESMAGNIVYGWSQLKGIRSKEWKYIDCPNPELYNMTKDPGEVNNLYSEEREIADQMQELLRSYEAGWADEEFQKSAIKNLDEESIKKLMSLGYIGSPSSITEGSTKDPKEYVDIHLKFNIAASLFRERKLEEGVKLLKDVLPQDKENKLALFYLGMAHHDLKRYQEAIDYLETLLALHPDHLQGYKRLASMYLKEKKFKELKETIERALEYFPEEAEFHYKMALTFLTEQNPDKALDHLKEAIRLLPSHGAYYLLSSKCHLILGEREKAIENIEQAAKSGYKNFSIIIKDPVFLDIIDDPSIQKVLQENY